MTDRFAELRTILADVRARWTRRALLRAWTLGAVTAAAMLMVGLLAVWLVAREGVPLVLAVTAVSVVAMIALVFALLPLRQPPSDQQVARFIEEQSGGLDDVLVTAVEKGRAGPSPITDLLVADAVRTARSLPLDSIVSAATVRRALAGATLASLTLLMSLVFFAPSAGRAVDVVGSYLFPTRYVIEVAPGSVKVRVGQPLTVVARIAGIDGGLVPDLTVGSGEAARSARMAPGAAAGEFTFMLNNIETSFPYLVSVGAVQSAQFQVDVIRPVRVARVDVRYEYPKGVGLAPQTEQDTGDIYAPAGTKAYLTITTDKAVTHGQLTLSDGAVVAIEGTDTVLSAALTVAKDSSYRIALNDIDGLSSEGTEYFIRMLNDRPPDVRILRPAVDRHVSPLEEVAIEARADDDYGVQSLELVFKTSGGKQTVVPLGQPITGSMAAGAHTVYLEDLRVSPGDFVTYYARARDVGRGRRATEARSDIFFLEVKPYEEEFTASESQAMGGMQGEQTGLEELVAEQKDIIAATWKLDARARRARAARADGDIKAVAVAQAGVREKAEEIAGDLSAAALAQQRRRRGAQPGLSRAGTEDPIAQAVTAMGQAVTELDRFSTAKALPFEEAALGSLLKAQAEIRRRQVAMQQAQGGGGNGNRQSLDLSTLFEQELRKRQQTNYETPSTSETRAEAAKPDEDPLAGIRELARRQEALARQQRELAKNQPGLTAEEIKRQLERLTRDQSELRKQAEELSKQPQQRGGQGGQGSPAEGQKLRDIADEMRNAEGDLRRQDPQQASARGDRASQQLRRLEQQMQGTRPDERRRAIGDLQMEARQLAEAERRLGNEAKRTSAGNAGEDARRRLAAEQERLAARTDRLGQSVRQLAGGTAGAEAADRQAMSEASRELDRQKLADRMRQSAQVMRQPQAAGEGDAATPDELGRALDKVAERLGAATGAQDGEAGKLSDQLARTQELRDRLTELQRTMDALVRAGASPEGQPPGQPGATGQPGSAEGGRGESVPRLQRDADNQLREARKLVDEVQRENPQMSGGTTPEQWSRSVSAPGTEAFKQDFAHWESLKKSLLVALDRTESQLSDRLRTRENKERLNAGRHDAVSETYRKLVDRYYQALAAPRKPNR
ncbi:MAG: hypothetical protein EXQ50_01225 [Acidobacteria bacterium]|nr:hypothetical protein [Acidobacteriota bacterium]MSO60708.1 hypothetical protein [Acidobacteriota bacterium]